MAEKNARPLPPVERLQELLFDAARLGREDLVLPLVSAGADVEAPDPKGHTALILASYHGFLPATQAILASGAYVDSGDGTRGNTALMGVMFKGYRDIALCLLHAGADVNRRNKAGQTALMMAALFGRVDMAEDLLSRGADVSLQDVAGNSAGSLAREQGNDLMSQLLHAAAPAVGVLDG